MVLPKGVLDLEANADRNRARVHTVTPQHEGRGALFFGYAVHAGELGRGSTPRTPARG